MNSIILDLVFLLEAEDSGLLLDVDLLQVLPHLHHLGPREIQFHPKYRNAVSPTIQCQLIWTTRSLGALWAPTSSWRPFGPPDFVLRALWALRPCDPRNGDWIAR